MHIPTSSNRSEQLQDSPIRKLSAYAEKTKKRGIHIHHLNIGQPDIPTPPSFWERIAAHTPSTVSYTLSQGTPSLRQVAVSFYNNYFQAALNEEQIAITVGGSEALLFAIYACTDLNDEVLTFLPCYTNYISICQMTAVRIKGIHSSIKDNFALPNINTIEGSITPKTKAILLCNPNNPTGYVYDKEEIAYIVELCLKHNLFLIVDEAYREFVYDESAYSLLSHSDIADRLIVIDTISKRYSACGARIGFLITKNNEIMQRVIKMAQVRLSPPFLGQIGTEALLSLPKTYYQEVRSTYQQRRDMLVNSLRSIEGVLCPKPKGAFYAMSKLPVKNAEHFCRWMLSDFQLNEQTVMMTPANGFYNCAEDGMKEVRIAYVLEKKKLGEAINCIEAGLDKYNTIHAQ